jgi:hypothetical protein
MDPSRAPAFSLNAPTFSMHNWLFSKRFGIGMSYSEKAGCTTAVSIFLHAVGELKAALNFDKWVHQYRLRFQKKEHGRIRDFMGADKVLFKVVRHPFSRAVSMYKHAITKVWKARAGGRYRKAYIKRMGTNGQHIETANNFGKELSFEKFVQYLEQGE